MKYLWQKCCGKFNKWNGVVMGEFVLVVVVMIIMSEPESKALEQA
jgi:hypothetical protein